METRYKGQIAELKACIKALEKGFIISKPVVDSRYDLVIDDGEKLWRVQVKYCDNTESNRGTSASVGLRRWAGSNSKITRNYKASEIDALVVYLPATDKLYWIPAERIDDKPSISLSLKKPTGFEW